MAAVPPIEPPERCAPENQPRSGSPRNRAFLASYREAYARWRAGLPAVFPAGTYRLRRFANVTVAPEISS